ncbi:hypothetical protein BT1A1_2592 [Caldibacillus thermoamylovorans]|uniref:Uncharacterized protein n=1 Tax=Caldibacillus thermoamylovorans TaxID=35841 RepID=A0A090J3H7_9BACI|nr:MULTISPECIES: hypothetical protein [Bacillaceae]PAC35352.1 hypothetical protein CEJ87_10165 [Caldifermentibacillus hisashii]CEE02410.1 hypothetical protein BT1A1_2592 [Caldibacillus thermoamylovorans]
MNFKSALLNFFYLLLNSRLSTVEYFPFTVELTGVTVKFKGGFIELGILLLKYRDVTIEIGPILLNPGKIVELGELKIIFKIC